MSWVKGHATEDHFINGQSSPLLKLGNDAANALANKGVLHQDDGLPQLMNFYSNMQHRAGGVLVRLHSMFLCILRADKDIREAKHKAKESFRKLSQGTQFEAVAIPATYAGPPLQEVQQVTMDKFNPGSIMSKNQLDLYNFLRPTWWKSVQWGGHGSV